MPSLIGSGIDANYRKQQVPYSRFGTRKVIWFSVGTLHNRLTDGNNEDPYVLDNEAMNTIIDAIQTRAEIAIIGAPKLGDNHGRFTVGIFEDTFNNGNDTNRDSDNEGNYTNAKSSTLEAVLRDATGTSVDVTEVYLFGGHHGDAEYDNGWNYSDTYQEYTTKAEYVANSYVHPGVDITRG